ncbi:MAG: hypothetical protein J6S61_01095, partial [Elusimicrobiaceae bacterium]|nr:hypothetical protein [Elusimicrobiaceae bacterium]
AHGLLFVGTEKKLNKVIEAYFNGEKIPPRRNWYTNMVLNSFVNENGVMMLFTLGIYACFYTLKSNGVFLNHVALISGLSKTKPYIAAFITFFILNFMALPPLTGMLSELIVLKEVTTKPVILYLCLFALLAMMPAFFKILQTIYFKQKENAFDRVDMRLYFYLFCIAGICILTLFKPELFFSQLYLLTVK